MNTNCIVTQILLICVSIIRLLKLQQLNVLTGWVVLVSLKIFHRRNSIETVKLEPFTKVQPICNCQLLRKQSAKNIRREFKLMSTKSVPFTTYLAHTFHELYYNYCKVQCVVQTFFLYSEIAFILYKITPPCWTKLK